MKQLYIFSGTISQAQYRDETGVLDRQGVTPGSTFEVTFKLDKEKKYTMPGTQDSYASAAYIAGSIPNRLVGNGSLYDRITQGEPSASIDTPAVPNRYSFSIYDNQKGFDEWKVGTTVNAHYEYKDDNKLSSFDTILTLRMITPNQ